MKNDSVRGGVKISIPPTLLFSAVGRISDAGKAVTLDFKRAGDAIYVLGETRDEMGGSEYLAMVGERDRGLAWLGGEMPRVDAERAGALYAALNRAIGDGLVRSAHTPALGGLATAFAMCAMGGMLGAEIDAKMIPSDGALTARSRLFSESNSRFVVSVAPENAAAFEKAMSGLPCARVGTVTDDPWLEVREALIYLSVADMKEAWKAPLREEASGPAAAPARPEAAALFAQAAGDDAPLDAGGSGKRAVRSLVITGYGLNCEAETAFALERAGASADQAHLNDIIAGKHALNDYDLIALIGGFSFGDHIAAGKVYANRLKFKLAGQLREFIEDGNLLIGICNGFQTLAKLGVLPGFDAGGLKQEFTIAWNDSGRFRDDWVTVKADPRTPCVFTRGIGALEVPIRHGEGKFFLRDGDLLRRMDDSGLLALRYVHPDTGEPTMEFPHNPNGSLEAVAGVCDPTGRIFGLMPHPEAFSLAINHPQWPMRKIEGALPAEGAGLRVFRNAVAYLQGCRGGSAVT
jgi:phosphoribosylformylglycinamidine synthase